VKAVRDGSENPKEKEKEKGKEKKKSVIDRDAGMRVALERGRERKKRDEIEAVAHFLDDIPTCYSSLLPLAGRFHR